MRRAYGLTGPSHQVPADLPWSLPTLRERQTWASVLKDNQTSVQAQAPGADHTLSSNRPGFRRLPTQGVGQQRRPQPDYSAGAPRSLDSPLD